MINNMYINMHIHNILKSKKYFYIKNYYVIKIKFNQI